jgi:hypothetical protein
MGGRFWVSWLVLTVLSLAIGFAVHGGLLHDDYSRLPNLLRTEDDAHGRMGWMVLANSMMGLGFTWIYLKGREVGKPAVGQGLRFGLAVAVLMTIPMYLIYYTVQPWPGAVVVKQIVFDTIGVLVMGVVVALINQERRPA